MTNHEDICLVWEWVNGSRSANPTKPCTCGARTRDAEARALEMSRHRALKPLGMSDDDFLRTLGITPIGTE